MSYRYEPFQRMTATQLANMLKSGGTPVIIDVRDEDFAGGHIRSAENIPVDNFQDDDDVDELVRKYQDTSRLVFHCMLSQVRGPFCAKRFLSRMAVTLDGAEKVPAVYVLTGGYENFAEVRSIQHGSTWDVY